MRKSCSNCRSESFINPRYTGKNHLCLCCLRQADKHKIQRQQFRETVNEKRRIVRSNAKGSKWFHDIIRAKHVLQNYDTIEITRCEYVEDCRNEFLNGIKPINIGPSLLSDHDEMVLNNIKCSHPVTAMINVLDK